MLNPARTFLKPRQADSRTQRLPLAPCPRMSSLDGMVTWERPPVYPAPRRGAGLGGTAPACSVQSSQQAQVSPVCQPARSGHGLGSSWPQGTSVPLRFCP